LVDAIGISGFPIGSRAVYTHVDQSLNNEIAERKRGLSVLFDGSEAGTFLALDALTITT
jgi:hypothetical protein